MDLVNQSGNAGSKRNSGRERSALKFLYLGFMVLSAVVAWAIFLQFLFSGSASIDAFFQQTFATAISSLWASDVLVSALIFFTFSRIELKRLGAPTGWWVVYFVASFSIGLCFSISLFLYQRETWRARVQP